MKNSLTESDKVLHNQFSQYGMCAKEWMRKCIMLLPEINRREIWKKKGFGSIYEYAAKIAGMSRNTVNEALRIFEKIADKPELKKVVEKRGINAVKPVIAIATIETSAFWARKAEIMSKNTLEMYVRGVREGKLSLPLEDQIAERKFGDAGLRQIILDKKADDAEQGLPRKAIITMELFPETAAELEKLKGADSWEELMQQLLELRKQKLEEQKPETITTGSRHIPAQIRKFAIAKTNGNCAFPGCTKPYQILHHTKRFVLTGQHEPETLQPLCKAHERIAHHSLIKNEHQSPEHWGLSAFPDTDDLASDVDIVVQNFRSAKKSV